MSVYIVELDFQDQIVSNLLYVNVFSTSGLQASVFSYVSEFHTRETAPRAASFVSIFMPIIYLYASIIGYVLIPMNWSLNIFYIKFVPWRLFIIVNASVNALIAVAFLFLPETPKFLLTINEPEESLKVLKQMYETNIGKPKEVIQKFRNENFLIRNRSFFTKFNFQIVKSYPVENIIPEASGNSLMATKGFANVLQLVWDQTKPIFVPPYLDSTVKLCFMVFTLFAIGHGLSLWYVASVDV